MRTGIYMTECFSILVLMGAPLKYDYGACYEDKRMEYKRVHPKTLQNIREDAKWSKPTKDFSSISYLRANLLKEVIHAKALSTDLLNL